MLRYVLDFLVSASSCISYSNLLVTYFNKVGKLIWIFAFSSTKFHSKFVLFF